MHLTRVYSVVVDSMYVLVDCTAVVGSTSTTPSAPASGPWSGLAYGIARDGQEQALGEFRGHGRGGLPQRKLCGIACVAATPSLAGRAGTTAGGQCRRPG
jgi:hypothetical protein